jgi:hypothetical protein
MSETYLSSQGQPYMDRSTGLIIFGVLTALLGGLCALFVPLMVFGTMAAPQSEDPSLQLRTLLPSVLFYGVLAVVLITLGIGSAKARRWARALMLVFSWSWLVFGIIAVVAAGFLLPRLLNVTATAGQTPMPDGAKLAVVIFAMAFYGVLFVVVPGIWVFFYRSRHVKATCEARDPVPRWTDRSPLPVLAVVLWLSFGALTMLMVPLSFPVLPFFGDFLTGIPAIAGFVVLAAVWGWCAWAMYRLDGRAWWVLLLVATVFMTRTS